MRHEIFYDVTLFSDLDIYFFKEGSHSKLYNHLGSHVLLREGVEGVYFALWAPNANSVSVRGDFNDYNHDSHQLKKTYR